MKFIFSTIFAVIICCSVQAQVKQIDTSLLNKIPVPGWLNQTYTQLGRITIESDFTYGKTWSKLSYDRNIVDFGIPQPAIDFVIDPLRGLSQEVSEALPDWVENIVDDYILFDQFIDDTQQELEDFRFGLTGKAKRKVTKWAINERTIIRYNHRSWRWLGIGFGYADPRVGTENPYRRPSNLPEMITLKGIANINLQNLTRSDRGTKAYSIILTAAVHNLPFVDATVYEWKTRRGKSRYIRWECDLGFERSFDGSVNVGLEFFVGDDARLQLIDSGVPAFVADGIMNYITGDGLPTLSETLKKTTLWGVYLSPSIVAGGQTGGFKVNVNLEELFGKGVSLSNIGICIGFEKTVSLLHKN